MTSDNNHQMGRTNRQEIPLKKNPVRKSKNLRLTIIENSFEEKFKILKEKNRESAQRSRDNKRKYIMGLENRISELVLQNDYLRKQLSLCHCTRQQTSADNTAANTGSVEQQKPLIDDCIQPSFYQRISVKSFTSCSNFLMLSLVLCFCVFGYVDVTGDTVRPPTGFYSMNSLKTALIHWNGAEPSCGSVPQPLPHNSLNYKGLREAEAFRNSIRPAPNQSTIKLLVEEQLQRNMSVLG